jgi:hypothetical protein
MRTTHRESLNLQAQITIILVTTLWIDSPPAGWPQQSQRLLAARNRAAVKNRL